MGYDKQLFLNVKCNCRGNGHLIFGMHSHKFITIELGKTTLLEFRGNLSTMSSFFCVVLENHGRPRINLEFKAKCSALFLNEIGKPMQQIQVGIPIPFFSSVGRVCGCHSKQVRQCWDRALQGESRDCGFKGSGLLTAIVSLYRLFTEHLAHRLSERFTFF